MTACAVEAHMLIWTNYVVAERGSVTDAECDKYCHCRNCQTNITHTHTNTHVHYDICICTITHAHRQHLDANTYTQVQMCACLQHAFTHNSSAGDGLPPNQHTGFNNEVEKLFVCRYFFCLSPSVFGTSG